MRQRAAFILMCLTGVAIGTPAFAQAPEPPGPYVIDLRGTTSRLPSAPGFFPPVSQNTFLPGRGWGLDVGGHVYVARLGPSRLGLGANVMWVRGTSPPPMPEAVSAGVTGTPAPLPPSIHATFKAVAPQVSFNFGSASGWSYVSAGAGLAGVSSTAIQEGKPDVHRSSGQVMTINFGGGARWFMKRRLAAGFDLRFHRMSAGTATPATRLFAASVGISLR